MPIVDYERQAELAKQRLYSRQDISKTNKKYLDKFFDGYAVSPARIKIFCKHIHYLMKIHNDIKAAMTDKDRINKEFRQLREELSQNYYNTVVNVSNRFVRWLNDGVKPKGFVDIKEIGKKKERRRKLSRDDMVTWEDGLRIIKQTNSVQFKALLMTQLDGGFRPSELVDLNYGDIDVKPKDFFIAHIKDGKTGERDTILFKSVPFLQRWLQLHPTKKKSDPLWITEYPLNSHRKDAQSKDINRYQYSAIRKRITELFDKAKVKKPCDFYNLRHSACYLAKLDNIPLEEAAKKFGHSTEFFTNVYGRLDTGDSVKRLKKHYGMVEEQKKKELNIRCSTCDTVNRPSTEICEKCGTPLTMAKALELDRSKDLEMSALKEQMAQIYKSLGSLEDWKKALEIRRGEK